MMSASAARFCANITSMYAPASFQDWRCCQWLGENTIRLDPFPRFTDERRQLGGEAQTMGRPESAALKEQP